MTGMFSRNQRNKGNKAQGIEHPGAILERAMQDQRLTPVAFAKALGISRNQLEDLFQRKAQITRATAGKLGRYFGNGSGAWLCMQQMWDEQSKTIEQQTTRRK